MAPDNRQGYFRLWYENSCPQVQHYPASGEINGCDFPPQGLCFLLFIISVESTDPPEIKKELL